MTTDSRNILLTQVLTVILTPACVALTFFLIERSKAPKPDIRYVASSPEYLVAAPSVNFVSKINDNPALAAEFRDALRQATSGTDNAGLCTAWLDGGDWDSSCLPLYKGVIFQVRGMLQGLISQGHGSTQESMAKSSVRILEDFRKELAEVESADQPRSGSVRFTVGVLNTGDSNGTVYSEAVLVFNNKVLHVNADSYTSVNAHGFSEISFRTAGEDAGKYLGTVTSGEEQVVKASSDLVKKGIEIPFELTITMNDKTDSIKGTVPKE